ncbi:Fanconi anemia group J protein homolog [Salvia splendens]|uniref:Fanconi anemia group J protein homolog n=1 Tax=Salvia splendens TaxID=180675 RepID=UPI001C253C62|nr:Fanconi anemia group J protein homolog [Salvia splendens]
MLMKETEDPCLLHNNVSAVIDHPSLANVTDIEEICSIGYTVQGCPYYASRLLAKTADLIICPYNYMINPSLREIYAINLDGNVLIVDEAHSIEDTIRENASFDIDEQTFEELLTDLNQVREMVSGIYQDLLDMTKVIFCKPLLISQIQFFFLLYQNYM